MRTMRFFAVCLLAFGVIGMCSAKGTQPKPRVPTNEDFCRDAALALMAAYHYSGTLPDLKQSHRNGHMMVELNRDNPNWINPATGSTEPSVSRGQPPKKH